MNRILMFIGLVTWLVLPFAANAQVACSCVQCKVLIDHGTRIYTCGPNDQSPGPCSCNLTTTDCVPCGCCQYIPGTGGVCYDITGGQCHLEGCIGGTVVGQKVVLRPQAQESSQEPSKEKLQESSPWLADVAFQQKIESLAPDVGLLIKHYQDGFKNDWKRVHYREGHTISGKVLLHNVSFNFSAIKSGSNWRLELSPDSDDPDSHPFPPDVANTIEILGHNWRLIHHIHGVDKTDNILVSGTY